MLRTIVPGQPLTVQDLVDADVVLISFNFFFSETMRTVLDTQVYAGTRMLRTTEQKTCTAGSTQANVSSVRCVLEDYHVRSSNHY